MELTNYHLSLLVNGLLNLGMGLYLVRDLSRYKAFPAYRRTRICCAVWMIAFCVGYLLHATFRARFSWPSLSSALTATYFHTGAICFSWGFIPLLDPKYFNRSLVIRDAVIYLAGLVCYWTVALIRKDAPLYTALSFTPFFLYGLFITVKFYHAYGRVSERLVKMEIGTVGNFVRWLQMCCDLMVIFGMGGVVITGISPLEIWPYILLLWFGAAVYLYLTFSVEKFGRTLL